MNNGKLPKVKTLSREEGKKLLNSHAKRYLGISGEEFVRRWKNKDFKDPEDPAVMNVAFLIPFGG